MKKYLITLLLLLVMIIPSGVKAAEVKKEKVNVYVFYGYTCPHCHRAFEYFDSIEEQYGKYFTVKRYETWLWDNRNNSKALDKVAAHFKTDEDKLGVPYIVIGDKVFLGYSEEYNDEIVEQILNTYEDGNVDVVAPILDKHFNSLKNCIIASVCAIAVLILLGVVNYLLRYNPQKMNS